MRTISIFFLVASLATGICAEAPKDAPPRDQNSQPAGTAAAEATPPTPATEESTAPSPTVPVAPPAPLPDENTDAALRLNFRNAPLNLVLDYLSDAAGFIINKETEVRGTVDVWSKDPVSKDEAVRLLGSVLKKNGYAVVRDGRILNIISMESAKTDPNNPVITAVDDSEIGGDEVVTQIIPVRYANASQLLNNLQVLLPTSATLSVNESANSLILVDTKRDIRRMRKIVDALDTSIASVSSIKVFPLKYADAKQLATVIQQLFSPQTAQMGGMNPRAQLFNMFRGGGGFPGGPGGNSSGGSGGAGAKVTAAADDYSNSLIVSASTELMATINDMVEQIDQPASDVTELRVFHLVNADPTDLADQINQLFPDDSRTGSNQNQSQGRFRFFGGRFGGAQASSGSQSDRMKKKGRVLAVPDARTSSLLVSAASELMPQLAEMITQLDASTAKKEVVRVFDLQNADPQDVNQVMQDLFNRNNTMRVNNQNSRSMLGQNNPLTQRQTQQQYNSGNTSGFGGNNRGSGSSGGF